VDAHSKEFEIDLLKDEDFGVERAYQENWNHGCTRINTDEQFISKSVCIRVHPWFPVRIS